ncbi:hypothetical protein [Oryza sativa Japonica Group]|uniref:Uncharacterized protein B1146F03.31 n=1 Tax=Oryza sativa subsp. japonica TaxID=39947 RepID=Q657I1_ORYSJ|nr:hypothetical protein [Oryza sativa Japonica Group]
MATGNSPSEVTLPYPPPWRRIFPITITVKCNGATSFTITASVRATSSTSRRQRRFDLLRRRQDLLRWRRDLLWRRWDLAAWWPCAGVAEGARARPRPSCRGRGRGELATLRGHGARREREIGSRHRHADGVGAGGGMEKGLNG